MTDSGTRNLDFGLLKLHGVNEKGFPSFSPSIFCHFWWFYKVEPMKGAAKLWRIIKYDKNLKENEENHCSICIQIHKTRFRVPDHSLDSCNLLHIYIFLLFCKDFLLRSLYSTVFITETEVAIGTLLKEKGFRINCEG